MSGGARSSPGPSQPPPPRHPPSSPSPSSSLPVVPPIRRNLAFASTKPPFNPSDYHRFAPSHLTNDDRSLVNLCRIGDREDDDVLVHRSPSRKRKTTTTSVTAPSSSNGLTSSGFSTISNSPCKTPVSAKGVRVNTKSKAKGSQSIPQTPISNAGSPATLTPSGSCRYDSSLDADTNLFRSPYKEVRQSNQTSERWNAGPKQSCRNIGGSETTGLDTSGPGDVDADVSVLQTEIENLSLEEQALDNQIRETEERLRELSENEKNQKWLFVTEEDIKSLPGFQNQTLIAVKAPHGTTLEVPDPDEAVDIPQRRYRIILRSTMGPIDVYLVSEFEKKFEDTNGTATPPAACLPIASCSGSSENHEIEALTVDNKGTAIEHQASQDHAHAQPDTSDLNYLQEQVGGMLKITPSDVENDDTDYWLLSNADISMTDIWKTDCILLYIKTRIALFNVLYANP
uniref:E2F transcription factor CC-MB domain-containing protein n=1 Tax=Brassica oleracea var. oleracea TaxID=109376 RepID=A0A0D3C4H5_BRAOL